MAEIYEHTNLTSVAAYLHHLIDISKKTQREIASEIGYEKANVLSMMKHGEMPVPLEKIPAIAKALDADPAHLFRLAMEQYWPGLRETITRIFGHIVSDHEMVLILAIRRASHDLDPAFSKDQVNAAADAALRRNATA